MKRNSAAVAGIILAVLLGNALTGFAPVGYHEECIDGIDNDGDGLNDADDLQCQIYPYEDGNGESETPPESQTYDGVATGYESLADYHALANDPATVEQNICTYMALSLYNEPDMQKALNYEISLDLNCGAAGP
tara:strand:- start:97 stop:498 length:402 start_codon:yes stop_codon:yes gene_type:complete